MAESAVVAQDPVRVISTPDQRLRVFVSSTLGELAAERQAVRRAVEDLHLHPVLFELGARPHPPRALYRAYLEQSDVFLGVYWQRYGWVAPGMEVSGLEDEYLLSGSRPALIYVKEPAADREPRLVQLLRRIQADDRASYKKFSTAEELAGLVADDLAVLLTERFAGEAASAEPAAEARRSPLPAPPTALVGREQEVADVTALLERPDLRVLTLTGPGGIGKTRLALEVAARALHRFVDGVQFVSLGAVGDPELVVPTVAAALGIHAEGPRPAVERLASELADVQMLLVLDNFEQVLAAGPDVAGLLAACPGLKVLVTSRAALRLRGEHQYVVPPLEVPPPDGDAGPDDVLGCSAVRLFVERAREARFDFELDAANTEAVVELCRRLDGIPLAIELAAARIRLLSPQALLDRLGDRIDLLSANLADLPPRQRTLRATIDWSYQLLDEREQTLFRRLGTFAGSISLSAAEAVCGEDGADVLEAIGSLVEKSLLVPESLESGEPRFRMLRTVREYARERLVERGELERYADRHLHHFVAFAEEAGPALRGSRQQDWLERLDRDLDELRAAMRRALDRDANAAVSLGYGLRIFWWLRDHMAEAREYEEEALTHLDELSPEDRAKVLFMAGASAWVAGDYAVAEPRLEESLTLARALGDSFLISGPKVLLAPLVHERGDTATAEAYLAEALQDARGRQDDPWGVAYVLLQYAQLAARSGDLERARVFSQELLEVARTLSNQPFLAHGLVFLGYLSLLGGDVAGSRALLSESARIYRGLRYREGLAYCLTGFAAIALAEGDAERAAVELGAAAALHERIGSPPWAFLRPIVAGLERAARQAAGEESFARAWQRGRSMPPDSMAVYALASS
jgi:predicted ATPase